MAEKPVRRARSGKRLGGRHPVSFVTHPDADRPISGLRFHKPSNRYYRIGERNTRVYYKRKGSGGPFIAQRWVGSR